MRKVLGIRGEFLCAIAALTLLGTCFALAHENGGQQQTSGETVYNMRDPGVTPPRGLSTPQPEYSDEARRKKISGSVLLQIIVEPDGSAKDVKIKKGLEKSLDKQAVAAVQKWTFQPGTKDGQPVAVNVDVEVTFRIR
ncbi:MAG TPA: energy transducer TonB [Candidatus Sulfotelmatobacter sp.]|nr:energy transducer TonB [Candidatus Sulfotelmatobacter sp.]